MAAGLLGTSPTVSAATTTTGVNIGIPITISGVTGLTDLTFTLNYNPALLNLGEGTTTGSLVGPTTFSTPTSATFTTVTTFTLVGTPSGGVASFSFHSAAPLNGTLTLGQIVAKVLDSETDQLPKQGTLAPEQLRGQRQRHHGGE